LLLKRVNAAAADSAPI